MNEDHAKEVKILACLPAKRHKQTELRYARQHVSNSVRLSPKLVRYVLFSFSYSPVCTELYCIFFLFACSFFLLSFPAHSLCARLCSNVPCALSAVKRDRINVCLCLAYYPRLCATKFSYGYKFSVAKSIG